jgi:hypothetical protein
MQGRNHESIVRPGDIKIKGVFHGTTSTGGALDLYDRDGDTIAVQAADRLLITHAQITVSVGGDTAIYIDSDAGDDLDNKEAILRGTLANNGTLEADFSGDPILGTLGDDIRCICASGTVDALVTGYIRKGS